MVRFCKIAITCTIKVESNLFRHFPATVFKAHLSGGAPGLSGIVFDELLFWQNTISKKVKNKILSNDKFAYVLELIKDIVALLVETHDMLNIIIMTCYNTYI